MPTQYTNKTAEHLADVKRHVDLTVVAKAASWGTALATKRAERAAAVEAFIGAPTDKNGAAVTRLQNEVDNLTTLDRAIESVGGAETMGLRELQRPDVFGLFVEAFGEKVKVLQKLTAPALGQLGRRRSALTESGISSDDIETDALVRAWKDYIECVRRELAGAVYGAKFCTALGKDHTPQSFDSLFAALVQAIPSVPSS